MYETGGRVSLIYSVEIANVIDRGFIIRGLIQQNETGDWTISVEDTLTLPQ